MSRTAHRAHVDTAARLGRTFGRARPGIALGSIVLRSIMLRSIMLGSIMLISCAANVLHAQAGTDTITRPSLEQSARRIVASVPYPTFITTDASGRPQARTVQPQQPDSAWVVWFATNPRTRKVAEIARDARVALHYFDQKTLSYVTLIGRARVVRDRATRDAHWDAAWSAFYPDRDTSVVLIAVTAERLEIVSSTLGISGDAATWRPPTVRLPRR